MITKKFDVEYSCSRFSNDEVQLIALVTTDKASHHCRLHKGGGRTSEKVWPDQGRTYTPQQEAIAMALFTQVEPDVWSAVDTYLVNHNYPTSDKIVENNLSVHMSLDVDHHVDEFRIEHRS